MHAVDHHRDDIFQVEALFLGQAGLLDPDAVPARYREAALAEGYFTRLSNEYRFLSKEEYERRRGEAEKFIKKYVDDGQQFIRTLSLRELLLHNTMYAIMQHQQEYFLTGDNRKLKPMILKTIAQEVGVDISTISRVSNSKYVQTDFGIIPLKHLFSEAVNDDEVSSKEIKQILGDLIESEDKKKPLSDDKLCVMLKEKGYDIARRTVAKYRDQLGIPVARLRKEL